MTPLIKKHTHSSSNSCQVCFKLGKDFAYGAVIYLLQRLRRKNG